MKRILLFLMLLSVTSVFAQDVIVKKDGSTILSKVVEIGTTEVKYKKFSNQNGPTYSILKSDIQAVNYENGEKDIFTNDQQPSLQETTSNTQIIIAPSAADNAEIISRYNRIYEHGKAIKDLKSQAKFGLCILGVGEESVLSTEDVVVEFRQDPHIVRYKTKNIPYYSIIKSFYLQLHNKTDNIIYVDLGSTFRIMADGSSKVYYDNSQTTISKGGGSGASVNLGAIANVAGISGALGTLANGVNVSGGNSASSSKVYTKQRIISIPPHGKVPLDKLHRELVKYHVFKSSDEEIISYGEYLSLSFKKGEMPYIQKGEKFFYQEKESPYHADYLITYSVLQDLV